MTRLLLGSAAALALAACGGGETAAVAPVTAPPAAEVAERGKDKLDPTDQERAGRQYIAQPLVSDIYTADPSVHIWEDGRIYIYPSHDEETGVPQDHLGSHFDMRDYIVLSMDEIGGEVTIHDVALHKDNVPWVGRQMWAPDAAYKDGTYFLYFPAKDKDDIFRIGVASSPSPTGPFTPQPEPMAGSYSIDPAVFLDADGYHYMYIGGIWGGQLQKWATGTYDPDGSATDLGDPNAPALLPKIARLSEDMLSFAEPLQDVEIRDEAGELLLAGDLDRRFFEGAWVFEKDGVYYLTYSTGDTHYIVYATGDNPYGPFTYRGRVLEPVEGWTSHHSIFERNGQWFLAYHDVQLSGKTHLRNVKITPLAFNADGTIQTITPMVDAD